VFFFGFEEEGVGRTFSHPRLLYNCTSEEIQSESRLCG